MNKYSYDIKPLLYHATEIEPAYDGTEDITYGMVLRFELYPTIFQKNGNTIEEEPIGLLDYYTKQEEEELGQISEDDLKEKIFQIMRYHEVEQIAEEVMNSFENEMERKYEDKRNN